MYSHKYRPIRKTADWVFITRTRGIEVLNMLFLFGAALVFFSTPVSSVAMPTVYAADTLNFKLLATVIMLLSCLQFAVMFISDTSPWRRTAVFVMAISSALWIWLGILTYHSSDWLNSVGVHRQLLYIHWGMGAICFLTADFIHDNLA